VQATTEVELKILMVAGLAGEAAAHRTLLDRLSGHLRAYFKGRLAGIGRSGTEAEDLVQEALLAIHTRRHTYDPTEPLALADRAAFLEDVAAALAVLPILGNGAVSRVVRETQSRYFHPELDPPSYRGRWAPLSQGSPPVRYFGVGAARSGKRILPLPVVSHVLPKAVGWEVKRG
jgi:Sigma-70 region 2